jgi:MoaA/NifB/PqqE/SkfB family radical SAM enzyme
LPLHTSLVTNGTLLKSRIDEIAPYINGIVFVSLDGLEKTHDLIRGVNGCFKEALQGITAAKRKVSVTINMTIMADNIHEVEDTVKLAKDLGVRIVLSETHEYPNTEASAPQADEIKKVAKQLIELKRKGYPIMNSTNYFKVIAKEKNWKCKPWSIINIGTDGRLVLPCYIYDQYETSASVFENSIKAGISSFDWRVTHDCVKCNLHCYVEPSLVLSWDLGSWIDWAFPDRT